MVTHPVLLEIALVIPGGSNRPFPDAQHSGKLLWVIRILDTDPVTNDHPPGSVPIVRASQETADANERELDDELRAEMPAGVRLDVAFDSSEFIRESISSVQSAALWEREVRVGGAVTGSLFWNLKSFVTCNDFVGLAARRFFEEDKLSKGRAGLVCESGRQSPRERAAR